MKKSLLLSAVAIAAFTANAEVINYDFNTNPSFFTTLYTEKGWSGEYDLVDKYGMDVNTSGTMFCEKNEEGNWAAVKNYCIDLVDGETYNLIADDMDEIDYSHPFICWDQDGVGPSRVHYFNGWNNDEAYVADKDYGAATEADFIASKGALGFLRQGNNASRTGTYVQFPAIDKPAKVTVWMCNQGGSYHEMGLYAEITPVINGEVGEMIPVQGPDNYVEKRYYKVVTELPAEVAGADKVALRVGCGGSQVQFINVAIEYGAAGIEGIYDNTSDVNAPVYNIHGVKVDDSYKGVVIKNGKKFIQK